MNAQNHYMRGAVLVLCGGLCLSSGGLIVRYIEAADGWQILFYRAISFAVTVLVFLLIRYRGGALRHFLGIGWPGAVAALALGFGFIFYLFGILLTNVANVVFIISAGPFLAALLAWLLLREPVRKATVAAMALRELRAIGTLPATTGVTDTSNRRTTGCPIATTIEEARHSGKPAIAAAEPLSATGPSAKSSTIGRRAWSVGCQAGTRAAGCFSAPVW